MFVPINTFKGWFIKNNSISVNCRLCEEYKIESNATLHEVLGQDVNSIVNDKNSDNPAISNNSSNTNNSINKNIPSKNWVIYKEIKIIVKSILKRIEVMFFLNSITIDEES